MSDNASYILSNLEAASKFANDNNANLVTGPINKSVISSVFQIFLAILIFLKQFLCEEVLMV